MNVARAAVTAVALAAAAAAVAQERVEFKGVPMGATLAEFRAAHPAFACFNDPKLGWTCLLDGTNPKRSCSNLYFYSDPRPYPTRDARECLEATAKAGTYANEPADMTARFIDGKLSSVMIYIAPKAFDGIAEALESRYGKPFDRRTQPVQNRAGATFENETAAWRFSGGDHILATRYGSTVTRGAVHLVSAEHSARFKTQQEEKRRAAPGDI